MSRQLSECIIVGNGPSACDLLAQGKVPGFMPIFGMNFSPIMPDYYVCVDTAVLMDHWREIYPLAERARTAYLSARHAGSSALYELPNVQLVSKDTGAFKAEQFLSGFTATYVALKMAYYLGFQTVHLWGVDHSTNWAHYRSDYPKPAADNPQRMWLMEWHYQIAAEVYALAGRAIINHSHKSRLDMIFRRA